jgi:uncharacterized membrane protein
MQGQLLSSGVTWLLTRNVRFHTPIIKQVLLRGCAPSGPEPNEGQPGTATRYRYSSSTFRCKHGLLLAPPDTRSPLPTTLAVMPRRASSQAAPGTEIILTSAPGTTRTAERGRGEMDYNHVMQQAGEVVDAAGVAVIVIGAVINTGAAAVRLTHHRTGTNRRFRQEFGQTILLGLELLVSGDIIRTVPTHPEVSPSDCAEGSSPPRSPQRTAPRRAHR